MGVGGGTPRLQFEAAVLSLLPPTEILPFEKEGSVCQTITPDHTLEELCQFRRHLL